MADSTTPTVRAAAATPDPAVAAVSTAAACIPPASSERSASSASAPLVQLNLEHLTASVQGAEALTGADLKVDVCILMDCTGSMGSWIEAAKATTMQVAKQVRDKLPAADYRLAFVGYRDYDEPDCQVFPFTSDVASIEARLNGVRASGGADTAEDVASGLLAVLALDWHGDTRLLFHVADAPAHGLDFHEISVGDSYPRGDKHGRDPRDSIRALGQQHVDYTFLKINSSTDKMMTAFHAAYINAAPPDSNFSVIDMAVQPGHGHAHGHAHGHGHGIPAAADYRGGLPSAAECEEDAGDRPMPRSRGGGGARSMAAPRAMMRRAMPMGAAMAMGAAPAEEDLSEGAAPMPMAMAMAKPSAAAAYAPSAPADDPHTSFSTAMFSSVMRSAVTASRRR